MTSRMSSMSRSVFTLPRYLISISMTHLMHHMQGIEHKSYFRARKKMRGYQSFYLTRNSQIRYILNMWYSMYLLYDNICLWCFSLKSYFGFTFGLKSDIYLNKAAHNLFYLTHRQIKAGPDNKTGYFGHRRLPPDMVSQLHLTAHNRGGELVLN